MTIAAVIFDFGGVITSSPFEAFNRLEAERGLPQDFVRKVNAIDPDNNAWARFERAVVSAAEFDALFAAEARAQGYELAGRDVLGVLAGAGGNLGQPDRGLDGFDLAEERFDGRELMLAPVFEEALGDGGDAPVGGVLQAAPSGDIAADLIDDRQGVLLAVLFLLIEEVVLFSALTLLSGGGHRRDQGGGAAAVARWLVERLAVFAQGVMPRRLLVRGVEDRMFEKTAGHESPIHWQAVTLGQDSGRG